MSELFTRVKSIPTPDVVRVTRRCYPETQKLRNLETDEKEGKIWGASATEAKGQVYLALCVVLRSSIRWDSLNLNSPSAMSRPRFF